MAGLPNRPPVRDSDSNTPLKYVWKFLASYKQTRCVCHPDIHHKICNKVHRQGSSGSEKLFWWEVGTPNAFPIEPRFVQVHAMMRSQWKWGHWALVQRLPEGHCEKLITEIDRIVSTALNVVWISASNFSPFKSTIACFISSKPPQHLLPYGSSCHLKTHAFGVEDFFARLNVMDACTDTINISIQVGAQARVSTV